MDNKNIGLFQIFLLIFFIFSALVAVLIFSGWLPGFRNDGQSTDRQITLWGTVPARQLQVLLSDYNQQKSKTLSLLYEEIPAKEFNQRFLEALAGNRGPDVVLLADDQILSQRERIKVIPYETVSVKEYQEAFIDGCDIFLLATGLFGLPVAVDPLVLYYNRDLFTDAGLTTVPDTWTAWLAAQGQLTKQDKQHNLSQSALSLGDFSNINNAKDILAMLLLQAGNPMVAWSQGQAIVTFAENFGFNPSPAQAALEFFLQFSNPAKSTYTWNRSLPLSSELFANNKLAAYLGFVSERDDLLALNPNLYLSATMVPQRGNSNKLSKGKFYALAVVANSNKSVLAEQVVLDLAGKTWGEKLSQAMKMPSVLRTAQRSYPTNAFWTTANQSAVIAKSWLDPAPEETQALFKSSADDIIAGRQAVADVVKQIDLKLKKMLRP